ncbi:arylsulfatase [Tundrisphaera lichenicola]|uniref:arylsulfatase n=1 Tax=Tundrisphaera lichenicola TaxID=2029860 RepID=UPI003EB9C3D7
MSFSPFIRWAWAILAIWITSGSVYARLDEPELHRPNVLLIMSDDQGYGDLGFHGNPRIQTPRIDALARESARFKSFYVSPVCSPTRSSLMTGRYHMRTGVVDTYRGRSMMHPDEVTIAEMLAQGGYRTGIFGKWHLGDNAPLRSIDQGFQESLVHRGGGLTQPSDWPGNTYFDPILSHNGKPEKTHGYCSDVYTNAAIRFIEADRSKPFFAYLAFNTPHTPLQVPEADLKPYLDAGAAPNPKPGEVAEQTARVYGMVTNLDRNVGRILDQIERLGLTRETIVIFLSDNGPQQPRENAGLRGQKGSVFDGGIKSPCFIRWPGTLEPGRVVEPIAAHLDLAPTLLAASGVEKPPGVAFDGRNLLPLLKGEKVDWPERTLYFQWHRGDVPELHRAFAARSSRFKLAQPLGTDPIPPTGPTPYLLFDLLADPSEARDIADRHPEIVASMLRDYEAWFDEVNSARRFEPPRIYLGSDLEEPVTLTRQDWRGEAFVKNSTEMGGWEVDVIRGGRFDITLHFDYGPAGQARLNLGRTEGRREIGPNATSCRFEGVELAPGPGRLRAWVEGPKGLIGANQIELSRRD